MNILSEEMANLKEFRLKTSISILCIDEAMVDSSYHKTQFHINGSQFFPLP